MITKDEFIFSVKHMFSTVLDGKQGYYIAPYQRGFKWGKYVRIMLQDIKNACDKDSDKDYFLNFISIIETEVDGQQYLELIDGQQRITTLVLFWSLVKKNAKDLGISFSSTYDGIDNMLTDKLLISRQRSEPLELLFDLNTDVSDSQDNFYLRDAIHEILDFLLVLKNENYNFQKFLTYFSHRVKIIINEEKNGISPAEIFGNLNSNKVDLTDTYLVKGLLLSLASRDADTQESKRYREIMESRTVMGRIWDELYYWIGSKPVKSFYFGKSIPSDKSMHPLDILIKMTAEELNINIEETIDSYPIFNSLYKHINKYTLATEFLEELKAKYWFLKRLYESRNNSIFNLLGLVLINMGNNLQKRIEIIKELSTKKDDDGIIKYLNFNQLNCIENIQVDKLVYGKNDNDIFKILLAVSVIDDDLGSFAKFDFYNYLNSENGWSIEHIFPQNISISKQSKKYIESWIATIQNFEDTRKDAENFKSITEKIYKLEGNPSSKFELDQLHQEATTIFERIVDSLNIETDSIGNLALLGLIDNIKLSNALFEEKKYRLLSYSSKGSFVPKHTFSIFNKSIISNSSLILEQTNIWTNKEIVEHKIWLSEKIETIKTELKENK